MLSADQAREQAIKIETDLLKPLKKLAEIEISRAVESGKLSTKIQIEQPMGLVNRLIDELRELGYNVSWKKVVLTPIPNMTVDGLELIIRW